MEDLDRTVAVPARNGTEALEVSADARERRAVRNRRDDLLVAVLGCMSDDLLHPNAEERRCHVGVVPRKHEHAGRTRRARGRHLHLGANESGGAAVWMYRTASSNCTMFSRPIHTSAISNAPTVPPPVRTSSISCGIVKCVRSGTYRHTS